jgi:hypothetical protein
LGADMVLEQRTGKRQVWQRNSFKAFWRQVKTASAKAVFKAFDERRVRYLVAGGIAVNAYGYLRFTKANASRPETYVKVHRLRQKPDCITAFNSAWSRSARGVAFCRRGRCRQRDRAGNPTVLWQPDLLKRIGNSRRPRPLTTAVKRRIEQMRRSVDSCARGWLRKSRRFTTTRSPATGDPLR